jgi:hypothetical protein
MFARETCMKMRKLSNRNEAREKFTPRKLVPLDPKVAANQFPPTPAQPVRQHARMAGC